MPWTETTRPQYDRQGLRYASDLRDGEWSVIGPFIPPPKALGRPRVADLREVLNAILYIAATGCQWKMLPKDFPPWQTVYWWFRRFERLMLFQTNHDIALMMDRAHPEHRVYPYRLKGLTIERPDDVWCADLTHISVRRRFLYLVAIMDWASRHVLERTHN